MQTATLVNDEISQPPPPPNQRSQGLIRDAALELDDDRPCRLPPVRRWPLLRETRGEIGPLAALFGTDLIGSRVP